MKRKLFGTDGIRGTANTEPITAETALAVAMSTAVQFRRGNHRHQAVIGKDTRLSGYLLEPSLTAGFISMGMDVILLGPLPTPGVAILTRSLRADLGVMISASHNSFEDNGIKLFGPDGFKLQDSVEVQIEKRIGTPQTRQKLIKEYASPEHLGRASRLHDASGRYIEYVKHTFPRHQSLEGLKIVVDCAHGAAYYVAPKIFFELGAEVVALGNEPDGFNINTSGTVDTSVLQRTVVQEQASLGIALDGDADRVVIVDERGEVVDGDQILALIATFLSQRGSLKGRGIVSTVMSNFGLEIYLQKLGLSLVRTDVGDRYVVEEMRKEGYNVGGEPSGHVILSDYSTTGDGLIAALQILSVLVEKRTTVSKACRVFTPVKQITQNIPYTSSVTHDPIQEKSVQKLINTAKRQLQDKGRLVIRKSGTESIYRVMVEGEDQTLSRKILKALVSEIGKYLQ